MFYPGAKATNHSYFIIQGEYSMTNNRLSSVCWDITSQCNEHCGFCYRNPFNPNLDLEDNKIIIKKLIDFGVGKISFVGGEPLLYDGLLELVRYGKKYSNQNVSFSITTNAILLTQMNSNVMTVDEEKMSEILELFDWVTFSLDADNGITQHKMGRNVFHYERVIKLLEYINTSEHDNKIKINTVVSQVNRSCIAGMYEILSYYHVKRWKLFRFLPSRGNAAEQIEKYYISEKDFIEILDKIKLLNAMHKIKVTANGYEDFDNSYITISSDGRLVVYKNNKYTACMDLRYESISKITNYINIEKHLRKRNDYTDA